MLMKIINDIKMIMSRTFLNAKFITNKLRNSKLNNGSKLGVEILSRFKEMK